MTMRFDQGHFIDLTPREANFVIEYSKDWNARRSAAVCGFSADTGYSMAQKPNILKAIESILAQRLETAHIDAEWLLMEAVDNHRIARFNNNITASTAALNLIAKHTLVDALASDKLNMNVQADADLMRRLQRGRERVNSKNQGLDEVNFF